MSTNTAAPPVVLVIGGIDPSGGAGLCADIQTLSSAGCHAAPVVTALTVQDTAAVKSFQATAPELVQAQLETVISDLQPRVVKTGMLVNAGIIDAVYRTLRQCPEIKLIVDPVISSNKDDRLSERSLIDALVDQLLGIASLVTPNLPEARILAGCVADADACALRLGQCDSLITGTHADSPTVINRYYRNGVRQQEWEWLRLPYEYHGSGCTLASAIAAGIAHGHDMPRAIDRAQAYVYRCLESGFRPGHGQHLPYRLCADGSFGEGH